MWLAERGWRATGADLSVVALEKARKHAGEAGVADRTEWVHVDLLAGDPLPGDADLVSAMYVHVPRPTSTGSTPPSPAPSGRAAPSSSRATTRPNVDTDLRNPRLGHLLFPRSG